MPAVCLCFQVHQPVRLVPYDFFRVGENSAYEDAAADTRILNHAADHFYLPANRLFGRLIDENAGRFRMSLFISGTAIDQMRQHRPDVLTSFQQLVATGCVELLAGTYYHSPAVAHSDDEFERQTRMHLQTLTELFAVSPRIFRPTGPAPSAARLDAIGLDGVITARNAALSESANHEHPPTPEQFARHLADCDGEIVSLFMNYETAKTAAFWEALPEAVSKTDLQWVTPSEAATRDCPAREYRSPVAWPGNVMQQDAIAKVRRLESEILATRDPVLIQTWARMQTADHFHWMSGDADGGLHSYQTPYPSAHDAYLNFMNVLADLQIRLRRTLQNG